MTDSACRGEQCGDDDEHPDPRPLEVLGELSIESAAMRKRADAGEEQQELVRSGPSNG